MKLKTAVIVDDIPVFLPLLKYYLHKFIPHVEAFTDPKKAAHYIHENKPDIVLADIVMPAMDGFELMADIRKMSCRKVLISANLYDSYSRMAELGVHAFVTKPLSEAKIVGVLEGDPQYEVPRETPYPSADKLPGTAS